METKNRVKIGKKEFEKIIEELENSSGKIFENYEINLTEGISIDLSTKSFEFRNCNFIGARIDFYDFDSSNEIKHKFQSLSFKKCKIENDLFIKNCKLYQVIFEEVEINSRIFYITDSEIDRISIVGIPDKYNLIKNILLSDLKGIETHLDFRLNDIKENFDIKFCEFNNATINANIVNRLNIIESNFNGYILFWKNKLMSYSNVKNNTFNNFRGRDTDYGKEICFSINTFLGNSDFSNSKNIQKTKIKFIECDFEKYVYFEKSTIESLKFESVFFKGIVSFQNTICNSILFDRTYFDKIAFFNDFKINNQIKCDLKTIILIKNQLLKSENKVDYLKYNAIEYDLMLNQKDIPLKEKILLNLNKNSNNFNTDWVLGVKFTFFRHYPKKCVS